LAFLELYDSLLDLVVAGLLVVLPTLPHCPADLVEPADDVLGYLQLQLIDILIIDILDRIPNKILIDAFTEHGTSLEYKPHLLLCQKISGRVILIQQKLPR
jgi:hypothetical protein